MIHPDTEVKVVNEIIGYGVFATSFIPRGTIVYVKDPLEVEVSPINFSTLSLNYQEIVEKYSYIDERGYRILSWDIAKYVNHSCNSNTISTGFGFEIAIRDIHPGEEITDEYGIFNLEEKMDCYCGSSLCRGFISPQDWDMYQDMWDEKVKTGLECIAKIQQPLINYMNIVDRKKIMRYMNGKEPFCPISKLRMKSGRKPIHQIQAMEERVDVKTIV